VSTPRAWVSSDSNKMILGKGTGEINLPGERGEKRGGLKGGGVEDYIQGSIEGLVTV
jgi:hypothetical protein